MKEQIDIEDVGVAVREARPLQPAKNYRIQVADGSLDFQPALVQDPIPLGRQILAAAGLETDGAYSLFAVLPIGAFEDVRLDEPFDLRGRGAERFIAFRSDRTFRFTLKNDPISWGNATLEGSILYSLGEVDSVNAVYLDVPGGTDRLIEPTETVDLSQPGVERFIVAPRPTRGYEIRVNSRPHQVPNERVTFEQVAELGFPGPQPPNSRFTMTFRHAVSDPHAGELSSGESVIVKHEGTIFNVTRTIKS